MRPEQIRETMKEAERFLDCARDALMRVCKYGEVELLGPCRESGALRRASMDLTRALADMRASR